MWRCCGLSTYGVPLYRALVPTLLHERILIIEDENLVRLTMRTRLAKEGYEIREAADVAAGLAGIEEWHPHLVLLDYRLPDGSGLDVLRTVVPKHPEIVMILMTAYSTVDNAVEAMRLGAYMYLNKPFDMEEMVLHVQKGLETTALRREVDRLRLSSNDPSAGGLLVAESACMRAILDTIRKVNTVGSTTVLLRGENGTGKDLLARYIHNTGSRCAAAFQNITCTALPDTLLESELFGHEKGAFTDARQRKLGLLELADGGTVFLDEIGDMSLSLQAKLLRFLEERSVRRVGGVEDMRVNVRIIAATNRDLEKAVSEGTFRQDLFYRLSVIPITVPPLRERQEDILALARMFVGRFATEFRKKISGFSAQAEACLLQHPWPGNVRELRNVVERALILGDSELIDVADLAPELRRGLGGARNGSDLKPPFALPPEGVVLEEIERSLVLQALDRTGNNQTQAARLLGITRDQIRYRLEKFQIE